MAISFNDNIKIAAPKPIDQRYLNTSNLPYADVLEVNTAILTSERYIGLTVNVANVEYWYEAGIADIDLVEKTSMSTIDVFVSGGTLSGSSLVLNRTEGMSDVVVELSGLTSGLTGGDGVVSGGTLSGDTLILERTEGLPDVNIDLSTLSDVYVSGATLNNGILELGRTEGLPDVTVDLSSLSGDSTVIYTGASPSNINVGGLISGTTLTGRTLTSIIEEMAVTTYFPTFVAPDNSFNDDAANTQEVGVTIGTIVFTANFDDGQIILTGVTQNPRSGLPNAYNYTGTGLPASIPSVSATDVQNVNSYVVLVGSNSWTNTVSYDAGPQPLDSDGNFFGSPLPAGTTGADAVTINGIYPWFYGKVSSGGAAPGVGRPTANQTLINGGTKIVGISTSTIVVPDFTSTSDDYIWFAIPSASTSKLKWYVNALNNGAIGGVVGGSNLFPDFDLVSINSPTALWLGINYKIYISNVQTSAATMEFRNS